MSVDRRIVPIENLSKQEIKSRLHLINDDRVRLNAELLELNKMELALNNELKRRED